MLDLLTHLIPAFSQMFSADTSGISAWFWTFIVVILSFSLFSLCRRFRCFNSRITALHGLLDQQDKDSLALNRRDTLQKAQRLNVPDVAMLWREFDESLVTSADQKQLFNTLDAEHFFNAKNLAPGLTASRLLAATPSFLVAVGVLGTFVGLTMGLGGLVGSTNEVETLKDGINTLISGASVAFMTSVWGVAFSLILNITEKLVERTVLIKIHDLQNKIDSLYSRIPAEQSLLHIAEHSKESKESLQELHERIGDRLQESVSGLSASIHTTLTDTLNNIMAPAIQSLIDSTNQQSSRVMESLISKFMEGMTSAGQAQGQLMQQAAADMNATISGMNNHFDELFNKLNEQHLRRQEAEAEQTRRYDEQLRQLLTTTDERQEQLETRFSDMMARLSKQLDDTLANMQERDEQTARQHDLHQHAQQEQQQKLLETLSQTSQQQISSMTSAVHTQQHEMQETVSKLLVNFVQQVSQHGSDAETREIARQERFQSQLDAVAVQQQELLTTLANTVSATHQQSQQLAAQHQELLDSLQRVTEATLESSQHMDHSANQLGLLSANVRSAADILGQRLEDVSQRIEQTGNQSAELVEHIKKQADMLTNLQDALLQGSQRLEEAANDARHGFVDMKQTQQQFLSGVKSEFTALGEALCSQVKAVDKQTEQWLHRYAQEVSAQVNDRMEQWNKHSFEFANKMLHMAEAMSHVLDELEQR